MNIVNSTENVSDKSAESKIKWVLDCQRDELLASNPHNYSSQEQWYLANNSDLVHTQFFSSYSFNFSHTTDNTSIIIDKYNRGGEGNNERFLENKKTTGVKNNNSTLAGGSEIVDRKFAYIPLTIKKYISLPTQKGISFENNAQWLQTMYEAVKKYKVPNYQGARIPVPSGLNIRAWRKLLENYDLPIIAEYLEFGFPVNIDSSIFTGSKEVKNHASAMMRSAGVDKYFKTETNAAAMIGPLENAPFENMNYSPEINQTEEFG